MGYLISIWQMAIDAAPWLVVGLLAAAVIRSWVPTGWIVGQLGRRGVGSVFKASVLGIPLPLCSCGVLPTALGLRRQGASKPATASFLVSTPEIGFDSFALSYVLLGPFMAVARPISAFFSAVAAGLAALVLGDSVGRAEREASEAQLAAGQADHDAPSADPTAPRPKIVDSLGYVFGKLWDDIKWWLGVAVVIAGVAFAAMGGQPAEVLVEWGRGPLAMLVMLVVGVPLYVCATASTPIAAALLVAGVSPGTVLVLLLAGPATNIGSLAILRKELGTRTVAAYLLAICVASLGAGMVVDWLVGVWDISMVAQVEHARHLIPYPVGIAAAVWLLIVSVPPVRRLIFRPKVTGGASCCGDEGPAKAEASASCCGGEPAAVSASSCCGQPPKAESSCCGEEPRAEASSCCGSGAAAAGGGPAANRVNSSS